MAAQAPISGWRRFLATVLAAVACRFLDWSCRLDPPTIPPGLVERIAGRIEARRVGGVEVVNAAGFVNWRDHV